MVEETADRNLKIAKIPKKVIQKKKDMKNKILTFKDFETEKIDRKTQRIIRGGDDEPIDPPVVSYPIKTNGGGNG